MNISKFNLSLHESSSDKKADHTELRGWSCTGQKSWVTTVKYADWETPENIRQTFGSADLLGQGSSRVVFNIGGNNYRMICKYHFGSSLVHLFVCWIGTYAEYDELCDNDRQYTVNEH